MGRRVESVLEHRGVELLLLKKVVSNQLETEQRAAEDQPSARLPDVLLKAVDFVPGSASVGQLWDRHSATLLSSVSLSLTYLFIIIVISSSAAASS